MVNKLWIDTDAGVDDAQAILIALSHAPDVEIVGISTVGGNTDCHQVGCNVLRLLKVAGHKNIPVYSGCKQALLTVDKVPLHYHGMDGFGDVPDPDAPSQDLIQAEHAVTAMLSTIKQHKGDISLVCLAPLTNVAMALRLDPDLGKDLRHCYIMGGNYHGRGNVTMAAEFNFHSDPEAAHIVLSDLHGCPITMVCWEVCLNHALPWKWYRGVYAATNTTKGCFINMIEQYTMQTYYEDQLINGGSKYETADPMLMAVIVRPDIVTESEMVYCTVELAPGETRGQMIADWGKFSKRPPNVTLVTKVDVEMYKELMLKALQ